MRIHAAEGIVSDLGDVSVIIHACFRGCKKRLRVGSIDAAAAVSRLEQLIPLIVVIVKQLDPVLDRGLGKIEAHPAE